MKLIKSQRVLTFILAVIFSTVIINIIYPMLFGNRHSVLTLASIQTTASGIPVGQSEIKKLEPLVAGTLLMILDEIGVILKNDCQRSYSWKREH